MRENFGSTKPESLPARDPGRLLLWSACPLVQVRGEKMILRYLSNELLFLTLGKGGCGKWKSVVENIAASGKRRVTYKCSIMQGSIVKLRSRSRSGEGQVQVR